MSEKDNRTVGEVVVELHDIARTMESQTPISMRQEAYEIRKIADRISHLERLERDERYKHTLEFTKHRPALYLDGDCND